MPKLKSVLWEIAVLIGFAAAGVAIWQWKLATEQTATAARLSAENRALRAKLDDAARERDALRQALTVGRPVEREQQPHQPDPEAVAKAAADARAIVQLGEKLSAAEAVAARLQERVEQLEGELKTVADENQRRTQSQQELAEKIGGLNRIIAAMEREAKSRNDRVVQLELTNKRLREENTSATRKSSEATAMASELQELVRRREVFLTSIISRYREVTDLFRSLSAMIENRSRQESSAGSAAELSRIQNSISMAEEDLRQLSSLNAQAIQLQRKISGK